MLEPLAGGPSATAATVRLAAIELETGSPATARRLLDGVDEETADRRDAGAQRAAAGARRQAATRRSRRRAARSIWIRRWRRRTTWSARSSWIAVTSPPAERAFREVLRQNRLTKEASLQLARTMLAAGRPREAIELAAAAGSSLDARLTLRARAGRRRPGRRAPARSCCGSAPTIPTSAAAVDRASARWSWQTATVAQARAHAARALDAGARLVRRTAARRAHRDRLERPGRGRALPDPRDRRRARPPSTATRCWRRSTARAAISIAPASTLEQAAAAAARLRRRHAPRWGSSSRRPDVRPTRARATSRRSRWIPASRSRRTTWRDSTPPTKRRCFRRSSSRATRPPRLPGDADVHDTLGWVAFRAGRLTLAASELERAVALDANEPAYRNHLQEVRRAIEEETAAAAAAKKRNATM